MYRFPGFGGGLVVGAGGAHELASTGFDSAWWIFFGMAILILGVFLFRAASQRRPRSRANGNR